MLLRQYPYFHYAFNFHLPEPGKILMTPLGIPAFTASSANLSAVSGVTWKDTDKLKCVTLIYILNVPIRMFSSKCGHICCIISLFFHWKCVSLLNWPALVWGPACSQLPGRQRSSTPASSAGSSREWWWRTRCRRDSVLILTLQSSITTGNSLALQPMRGVSAHEMHAVTREQAQEIGNKSEMYLLFFQDSSFISCLHSVNAAISISSDKRHFSVSVSTKMQVIVLNFFCRNEPSLVNQRATM